jgi:S1-C subfamily serine protease
MCAVAAASNLSPMTNSDPLVSFSDRVQALVERAAPHVVRVEGRGRSASSGVAFSSDGLVVATHHSLDRDEEIAVGLPSGETSSADVLGRDPTTDLAVLRVKGGGLAPVEWGDAPLAAGALVVAVSRPGRSPRAELGLVARAAGEWRPPTGGKLERYLETTLELRPGLSGALVLSAAGTPAGIATSGLVRGAALVLDAGTLRRVVKSLLAHGEIRRGYLGLASLPVPLPPSLRERTGEEVALLVTRVEAGSPAERAGLLLGDAILSFGGETLQDPGELLAFLTEDRIGDALPLRILRAGEVRELSVTVGARGGARA